MIGLSKSCCQGLHWGMMRNLRPSNKDNEEQHEVIDVYFTEEP